MSLEVNPENYFSILGKVPREKQIKEIVIFGVHNMLITQNTTRMKSRPTTSTYTNIRKRNY